MKTQEEIRATIDTLLQQDRLEEAEALIDQLIPISAEEFRRRLDEAPYDDEPVSEKQRQRYDEAKRVILAMSTTAASAAESR